MGHLPPNPALVSDCALATIMMPRLGHSHGLQEAERLAREKGWAIAADGDKWRRVVASPDPQAVVEARAIQLLLANNVVPICCGGWGEAAVG